jgi:hypothetical protein
MDGGIQRSKRIGTVDKFPTRAAAEKKATKLREEINDRIACIKISGLCDRYAKEAMPARMSTSGPYRSYLKRIKDDWGHIRVDVMAKDIMGVETWIDVLHTIPTEDRESARGKIIKGRPARPVSRKTKFHMKWFVNRLFECAIKWDTYQCSATPSCSSK